MKRMEKLLPPIILIILPFLLFLPVFFGKMILVGDLSGSDLMDMHYPFKYSLHKAYTNGESLVWEPNLSLGFPLGAEGQSGPYYPLNIALSFISPELSLQLSIIFVFIISSLGMYLYCRTLKFSAYQSVFSAILFSYSAFFITRIKHLNLIAVSAWLPLSFWVIRKFIKKQKYEYAVIYGMIFALQFLLGHPQITFYNFFITTIYLIFETLNSYKKDSRPILIPKAVTFFVLSSLIMAGLSAIQIIPTLEFTNLTSRRTMNIYNATAYPFRLKDLSTFLSPYLQGNPADGTYRADIRTSGVFWENSSYFGILGFALSIYGIYYIVKNRRNIANIYMFWIILSALSLLIMLGSAAPVFLFLWNNIPGFTFFRFPNRFNLYLIFSFSVLAGLSMKQLVSSIPKKVKHIRNTKDKNAEFIWPFNKIKTQILIIFIALADLVIFANTYISYIDKDKFTKPPVFTETIKNDDQYWRTYSLTQYTQSPYQALGWKENNAKDAIISTRENLNPDWNIIYDIPSISNRAWFEGGLSLERRDNIEEFLLYENENQALVGKVLGLYSVKYIVTYRDYVGIEVNQIKQIDLEGDFPEPLRLYQNDQVMPRVYFTPEAKVVKSPEEAFKEVTSLEHFSPKTVILEDKPRVVPEDFADVLDDFKQQNPVMITNYQNTKVEIDADITKHGFLVFNDIYYPGWKAQACNKDGSDCREQNILQANYLVRALELDPGEYKIIFSYEPISFKVGSIVTLSTLGLLISIGLLLFVKKKLYK
ncbi:hypothetical protein JXA63_05595 [Candidatus Woesebacteria bacterium]|nr:hypothetical protein [Candidatus Woesebacteria bacterium]